MPGEPLREVCRIAVAEVSIGQGPDRPERASAEHSIANGNRAPSIQRVGSAEEMRDILRQNPAGVTLLQDGVKPLTLLAVVDAEVGTLWVVVP